jgi:hypothetical protein
VKNVSIPANGEYFIPFPGDFRRAGFSGYSSIRKKKPVPSFFTKRT